MKNTLKLSLSVAVLLFLFQSFSLKSTTDFIGTYGDSIMELVINEDHTFTYKSSFNSNNVINEGGTWELKGDAVILKCKDKSVPKKWKVKNAGKTVKSRKGMIFYTLQKDCK